MHVHVDIAGRHRHREEQRWANAGGNRRPVRGFRGADDAGVAHRAAIDREQQAATREADIGGTLHETRHAHRSADVVHIHERIGGIHAPERGDALAQGFRRREHERFAAVMRHRESHIRARERHRCQHIRDRAPFAARAAQKLLAGGRIVEKRIDGDGRPAAARGIGHAFQRATCDLHSCAFAVAGRRFDFEARHRTNCRKSFAAKAETRDADQVARDANLRRRMTLDGERGIRAGHAASVIAHPDRRAPALGDGDFDARRAGVECILDEFLHDGRRTLDHFARGDLVGDRSREDCDSVLGLHSRNLPVLRTGVNRARRRAARGVPWRSILPDRHRARAASTLPVAARRGPPRPPLESGRPRRQAQAARAMGQDRR